MAQVVLLLCVGKQNVLNGKTKLFVWQNKTRIELRTNSKLGNWTTEKVGELINYLKCLTGKVKSKYATPLKGHRI